MINYKNNDNCEPRSNKKNVVALIQEISIRKSVGIIFDILEDLNADEIVFIDVKEKSFLSDYLIICQGNSQPHCRSIAEKVEYKLKKEGRNSLGMEGEREGNWVLLDFGEIILHVFHPEIRKYYNLEELYSNKFWLSLKKSKNTFGC